MLWNLAVEVQACAASLLSSSLQQAPLLEASHFGMNAWMEGWG